MVCLLLRLSYTSVNTLKSIPSRLFHHLPQPQLQNQPRDPPFYDAKSRLESELVCVLDGCNHPSQLKQVHGRIYRTGLEQCCYVVTKLVRVLTNLDDPMFSYSRAVLDTVNKPNPFLYTALIRGYSVHGSVGDSIVMYRKMREYGMGPVSFTFTAIFKACGVNQYLGLGKQMHTQMVLVGGFDRDLYVGNSLIDMYVKCGKLGSARNVFDEMLERDVISWTTLIVAYSRNGNMGYAEELFDSFPKKDLIAWTAMVTGFAQNNKPREALIIFEKMQNEGVKSDEITLVGVVSACAQLGAAEYANWVTDIARRIGLNPTENVVVGSAMIDMHSKCGQVMDAYNIFQDMKEKNVYTYSSMISGFSMHGHTNAALQLFHDMTKTNIKPNGVTFIGVLTACSHGGMVEQGREIFKSMEKVYNVSPDSDLYACLVDLLGRAGKLEEALDVIHKMPVKPHGGVWGALLGACKIHLNPEVAEIAANHLFVLEPEGISNYILLSNIYASCGRQYDVLQIRKLIRAKGLRKNPGKSFFELKIGEIHEFVAGDMTHPQSHEIKQVLDDLLDRLKVHGYEPNLNSVPYDVNDVDKKRILITHSEKLALAFGLLSSRSGSVIRIVKNLRICEDCHSFMCIAALVTGREIVVRDTLRFHHFREGLCSCGNYW